MKRAALVSLTVLTVALGGCRDSAFSAASKQDTIEAYRQFIAQHPSDENIEAANERLSELELEQARKVHTVVAYKRFLDAYPEGERSRAARALLEGLRFNATKERGT